MTYTTILLLVLLLGLAYLTRNTAPDKRTRSSGLEPRPDPIPSEDYEDPSSFMMGGSGGVANFDDGYRDPTKADCVSALMIMLSITDELSETFTDADLIKYTEYAEAIFKSAMAIQTDDQTLDSREDIIVILWALVSERPRSQWLAVHLLDLLTTLGLDDSEFITKSRTVDTQKLLGKNWQQEAATIVDSQRSEIKPFAPDELDVKATRIVAELLKTSKPIPMMLEAYESRSFETWGHFNWDGHFIAQSGLALVRFSGTFNRDKIIAEDYVLLCDSGAGGVAGCYLADGPDGLRYSIEENLNGISFDILVGQTTLYLGTPWHVWKNSPYSDTYFCTKSRDWKEYSKDKRDVTTVPVIADIIECFTDGPKMIWSDDGSHKAEHHWYPYSRIIEGPRVWVFSIGSGSDHVKFDVTDGNLDDMLTFLGLINSTLLELEAKN